MNEDLENVILGLVTIANNFLITVVPSLEEAKDTLFEMDSDSASGLDGFLGKFFHACWDTIGLDILVAIMHFFITRVLHTDLNSNYMVFIPKTEEAISIYQF